MWFIELRIVHDLSQESFIRRIIHTGTKWSNYLTISFSQRQWFNSCQCVINLSRCFHLIITSPRSAERAVDKYYKTMEQEAIRVKLFNQTSIIHRIMVHESSRVISGRHLLEQTLVSFCFLFLYLNFSSIIFFIHTTINFFFRCCFFFGAVCLTFVHGSPF